MRPLRGYSGVGVGWSGRSANVGAPFRPARVFGANLVFVVDSGFSLVNARPGPVSLEWTDARAMSM